MIFKFFNNLFYDLTNITNYLNIRQLKVKEIEEKWHQHKTEAKFIFN